MGKWRPKGWGNPYTINPQTKDYPKNAFEQGANAMLEAVCEEIEKAESLHRRLDNGYYVGFDECRQEILSLFRKGG